MLTLLRRNSSIDPKFFWSFLMDSDRNRNALDETSLSGLASPEFSLHRGLKSGRGEEMIAANF
jgi:hypothetical protein